MKTARDSKEKGIDEPLFGSLVLNKWMLFGSKFHKTVEELENRFGHGGGILMDYACLRTSFGRYCMWCDVSGIDDYNVDMLERVVEEWERFLTINEDFLMNANTHEKMHALRSRCFSLRYEISKLKSKVNDNL